MITTLSTQSAALPQYAVSFVQIERERGAEVVSGYRVGTDGPIYRDFDAAQRAADRRRERDERIESRRLVAAKAAAARVLATAASKATASRRGVAVVGGKATATADPVMAALDDFEACDEVIRASVAGGRREFGAGLGV